MGEIWRRCSVCKEDIAFVAPYYSCSVTTCNKVGRESVFCSIECWDAHVPVMNHKDASFEEAVSPEKGVNKMEGQAEEKREGQVGGVSLSDAPQEVLIVVSKLKDYIQKRGQMNTSGTVATVLSDFVRRACDSAIECAAADGRKTVMDRDFKIQ